MLENKRSNNGHNGNNTKRTPMITETQINTNQFFASILAAIDYERRNISIDKLNSIALRGLWFEVSEDGFEVYGDGFLTTDEMDYLRINQAPTLCTLQQSLLMKYGFANRQDLFADYSFEIEERRAIMTDGAAGHDCYFEAVADITRRWFAELLEAN